MSDPLPERISDAFADLIFGADPSFTAADEADQERLDDLIDENDLPSELQRAAGAASWARDREPSGRVSGCYHSNHCHLPYCYHSSGLSPSLP
jgi:hypothetical protein